MSVIGGVKAGMVMVQGFDSETKTEDGDEKLAEKGKGAGEDEEGGIG